MKYKYLLIEKGFSYRKVISLNPINLSAACRQFRNSGHKVLEVTKPPALRTIRRWKQLGYARAVCGCKISSASGERCEVHNVMSWLTVLAFMRV